MTTHPHSNDWVGVACDATNAFDIIKRRFTCQLSRRHWRHVAIFTADCHRNVGLRQHQIQMMTLTTKRRYFALFGRIAPVQALPPIATHFSIAGSVCVSVVCHTRAPCLNRSTDLHAIWQVHLWDPTTHCVRWGSLTPEGKGRFGGQTHSQSTHLQIAAATWRTETWSDSAYCQITLVLVCIRCWMT